MLEKEYIYYLNHKKAFLDSCEGRVVVIKEGEILGVYDTKEEALKESVKAHALGTFLIQEVSEENGDDIQRFHSRVYV